MDHYESYLKQSLATLNRRARWALSAYVAERVVAVYEFSQYTEHGGEVLRKAASFIWDAVHPEKSFTPDDVARTYEAVSGVVPANEQDEPGYSDAIMAGVTVLSAIDSLRDDSIAPAYRSCLHHLSAFETVGDDESIQLEVRLRNDAIKLLADPSNEVARSLFADFPGPMVNRFM